MPRDGRFAPEVQVKQFVACVKSGTGNRFMVLETGDSRYYFFQPIVNGCAAAGMGFPVEKSRLRDDVRRALAHGYGNCGMRPEEDGVPFQFLPPGARWVKREWDVQIKIEKPAGATEVKVELLLSGAKKPITLALRPEQVDMVVQMLVSAKNADHLRFALEL